jgi:multidrug efflux pump
MSRFFVDRPIFAAVLSIVITLTGILALVSLPVAQYPQISPPQVQVAIAYPGASAQVVADTVAAPIEQQVNGVPGMLYMSSLMGNDGSYTLSVTFDLGTDLNTALVMGQNRVQLAMPQLPSSVQKQGITIRKKTPDILQVINFYSPDGRYDALYLSNFADIYIRDPILRVDGVSDIGFLGEKDYSIRVWLDPEKLAARGMTAIDVANAVRHQNIDAVLGQIGQPPAGPHQSAQIPLNALGRLSDPAQYKKIVVKVDQGNAPPTVATIQAPTASGTAGTGAVAATLLGSSGFGMAGTSLSASAMTGSALPTGGTGSSSTGTPTPSKSISTMSSGTSSGVPGGASSTTAPSIQVSSSSGSSTCSNTTTNQNKLLAGLPSPASVLTTSLTSGGAQSGSVLTGGASGPGSARALLPRTMSSSDVDAGKIAVNQSANGQAAGLVYLSDVARVTMGAYRYQQNYTFNGRPAIGFAVYQLPGSNALDVADRVRQTLAQLKDRFPDGVDYQIGYDFTQFISESVADVERTLLEAIALVALVVLIFLQNWRAALIPLIAVPVAVVGTFAVMAALHFTIKPFPCSAWCWRSESWWTTPLWWWKTSSAGWNRVCRSAKRRARPWTR